MNGGNLYNDNTGIWNAGNINISSGEIGNCTTGIENYGNLKLTGGALGNGVIGIDNSGICNMSGGQITGYSWGVRNSSTFNMSGGNINNNSTYGIVNQNSNSIIGQLYITGGNIIGNTNYDIYHEKSDTDGAGAVYGGLRIERNDTVNSSIYLATYNNYIYVGSSTPQINSITLGDVHLERQVIRAASTTNASTMVNKINVKNKGNYYCKANAEGHSSYVVLWTNYTITTYYKTDKGTTLDSSTETYAYKDSYMTSANSFEGYVLKTIPSNASGIVTGNISVTYIYEDDRNIAVVNYEDLLSGVQSAVYWYNANSDSFDGNGESFEDGKVFEDYGFYKVTVTNGVGLTKTMTFVLDKNSV